MAERKGSRQREQGQEEKIKVPEQQRNELEAQIAAKVKERAAVRAKRNKLEKADPNRQELYRRAKRLDKEINKLTKDLEEVEGQLTPAPRERERAESLEAAAKASGKALQSEAAVASGIAEEAKVDARVAEGEKAGVKGKEEESQTLAAQGIEEVQEVASGKRKEPRAKKVPRREQKVPAEQTEEQKEFSARIDELEQKANLILGSLPGGFIYYTWEGKRRTPKELKELKEEATTFLRERRQEIENPSFSQKKLLQQLNRRKRKLTNIAAEGERFAKKKAAEARAAAAAPEAAPASAAAVSEAPPPAPAEAPSTTPEAAPASAAAIPEEEEASIDDLLAEISAEEEPESAEPTPAAEPVPPASAEAQPPPGGGWGAWVKKIGEGLWTHKGKIGVEAVKTAASVAGVRSIHDVPMYAYEWWKKGRVIEDTVKNFDDLLRSKEELTSEKVNTAVQALRDRLKRAKLSDSKIAGFESKISEIVAEYNTNRTTVIKEERTEMLLKIKALLGDTITTNVKGMQAAREAMNTAFVLTGAFALRGIGYGIMALVERGMRLHAEKKFEGKGLKEAVWNQFIVDGFTGTFKEAAGKGEAAEKTGIAKAAAIAKAWGTLARFAGITYTAEFHSANFEQQWENIMNAVQGKMSLEQVADNFLANVDKFLPGAHFKNEIMANYTAAETRVNELHSIKNFLQGRSIDDKLREIQGTLSSALPENKSALEHSIKVLESFKDRDISTEYTQAQEFLGKIKEAATSRGYELPAVATGALALAEIPAPEAEPTAAPAPEQPAPNDVKNVFRREVEVRPGASRAPEIVTKETESVEGLKGKYVEFKINNKYGYFDSKFFEAKDSPEVEAYMKKYNITYDPLKGWYDCGEDKEQEKLLLITDQDGDEKCDTAIVRKFLEDKTFADGTTEKALVIETFGPKGTNGLREVSRVFIRDGQITGDVDGAVGMEDAAPSTQDYRATKGTVTKVVGDFNGDGRTEKANLSRINFHEYEKNGVGYGREAVGALEVEGKTYDTTLVDTGKAGFDADDCRSGVYEYKTGAPESPDHGTMTIPSSREGEYGDTTTIVSYDALAARPALGFTDYDSVSPADRVKSAQALLEALDHHPLSVADDGKEMAFWDGRQFITADFSDLVNEGAKISYTTDGKLLISVGAWKLEGAVDVEDGTVVIDNASLDAFKEKVGDQLFDQYITRYSWYKGHESFAKTLDINRVGNRLEIPLRLNEYDVRNLFGNADKLAACGDNKEHLQFSLAHKDVTATALTAIFDTPNAAAIIPVGTADAELNIVFGTSGIFEACKTNGVVDPDRIAFALTHKIGAASLTALVKDQGDFTKVFGKSVSLDQASALHDALESFNPKPTDDFSKILFDKNESHFSLDSKGMHLLDEGRNPVAFVLTGELAERTIPLEGVTSAKVTETLTNLTERAEDEANIVKQLHSVMDVRGMRDVRLDDLLAMRQGNLAVKDKFLEELGVMRSHWYNPVSWFGGEKSANHSRRALETLVTGMYAKLEFTSNPDKSILENFSAALGKKYQ